MLTTTMDESVKTIYIKMLRDEITPHQSFELWNLFKRVVLLDDISFAKDLIYPEYVKMMIRYRTRKEP